MPTNDVWELNTQSFVIRLWIEESETESRKATWRGYISHVAPEAAWPGGRGDSPEESAGTAAFAPGARRYVQDLAEITEFLGQFLGQMGVDI